MRSGQAETVAGLVNAGGTATFAAALPERAALAALVRQLATVKRSSTVDAASMRIVDAEIGWRTAFDPKCSGSCVWERLPGPVLVGVIYKHLRNYDTALAVCVSLCTIATITFGFLPPLQGKPAMGSRRSPPRTSIQVPPPMTALARSFLVVRIRRQGSCRHCSSSFDYCGPQVVVREHPKPAALHGFYGHPRNVARGFGFGK
jgi:hypothetical protein